MVRIMTLLVAVAAVASIAMGFPQADGRIGNQDDVNSLKEQRIQLLQNRVAVIKKYVDRERVGSAELLHPEMDVIIAQLDYADSDDDRKRLLGDLLVKYDMLIEIAKFRLAEPPPIDSENSNWQMLAESDLLHLKSERIRINIVQATLK